MKNEKLERPWSDREMLDARKRVTDSKPFFPSPLRFSLVPLLPFPLSVVQWFVDVQSFVPEGTFVNNPPNPCDLRDRNRLTDF